MKLIVENIAVEYSDIGNGSELVLLLHGWQDNLHTFDLMSSYLKKNRLIALDLPGFGNSELPPNIWNLDDYINFVVSFINKLNIKPKIIIGHSFGGRIIIKGISKNKFHPSRIILISSAGIAKNSTLRNQALKILAKIGKVASLIPPLIFWRKKLKKELYKRTGSNFLSAGYLQPIFLRIIKEDLSLSASNIKIPTLLIWGENDTETPINDAKMLNKLIEGSILEIIPDSDHFVQRTNPKEVAKLINEFIR